MVISAEPLWTDQVEALGTAFAAVLTAVSVFLLVLDSRRRNRELRDAEAAQARLVTFRFLGVERGLSTPQSIVVKVFNDSTAPIRWLTVTFTEAADPTNTGVVGPVDMVRGGQTTVVSWQPPKPVDYSGRIGGHVRVVMEFEDAAGLLWERRDVDQPRRRIPRPAREMSRVEILFRRGLRARRLRR